MSLGIALAVEDTIRFELQEQTRKGQASLTTMDNMQHMFSNFQKDLFP